MRQIHKFVSPFATESELISASKFIFSVCFIHYKLNSSLLQFHDKTIVEPAFLFHLFNKDAFRTHQISKIDYFAKNI